MTVSNMIHTVKALNKSSSLKPTNKVDFNYTC